MQAEDRGALRALVDTQRQAALATLADNAPFASMVLYATERRAEFGAAIVIHVSRLSAHTRHLLANPQASLLVMQPDNGTGDPQALPRVTIQVGASVVSADEPGYAEARAAYLARLPQQAYLFDFPDFLLVRLVPTAARYVGGFAKAFTLSADQFQAVLA